MTSLRACAFATTAGLLLLAGCSLATSLAGLAASTDDAGATVTADGGPGVSPDGSVAPYDGGAGTMDGSMTRVDWGTVTIVQSKRSTGKPGVDLDQPTKQGTLLVVLCPDPKPPIPSGLAPKWQMLKSSYGGAIVIWPDNPGGITHFTIMDANNDLFFLEMSGVPADVQLSQGTSASADVGWTSLGTDTNNDYAWYRLNPTAPFGATVTFSPLSPAQMMMVQMGNGK